MYECMQCLHIGVWVVVPVYRPVEASGGHQVPCFIILYFLICETESLTKIGRQEAQAILLSLPYMGPCGHTQLKETF